MKRGYIEKSVENYYCIVKKVAAVMLGRLSKKMVFQAKLERLSVSIFETDGISIGMCKAQDEDDLEIEITVNPGDKKELIELIIAHELAHLLISIFDQYADFCVTDESFAVSGVMRKSEGEVYGKGLEETLCDYIAIDVIHRLHERKISKEDLLKIFEVKSESWRVSSKSIELLERLINLFEANEIAENDCYDAMVENKDKYRPKNLLLYGACTGHLNVLVNDYDDYMGKGAWKRLNKSFDRFFLKNFESLDMEKIVLEIKIFELRAR